MNGNKYAEEMETKYHGEIDEWVDSTISEYIKDYRAGKIERLDLNFIFNVSNCLYWNKVKDIADKYIVKKEV